MNNNRITLEIKNKISGYVNVARLRNIQIKIEAREKIQVMYQLAFKVIKS